MITTPYIFDQKKQKSALFESANFFKVLSSNLKWWNQKMVLEGSSIKFRNCNLITSCIFFHRLLYPKSIAKSFWVKSITTSFSIFNFSQGLTILLLHYSHEKGYCSPFNLENGFPVSAVFSLYYSFLKLLFVHFDIILTEVITFQMPTGH